MPKGKVDTIDLFHLTFEEEVTRTWDAETLKKDGQRRPEQIQNKQDRQIRA